MRGKKMQVSPKFRAAHPEKFKKEPPKVVKKPSPKPKAKKAPVKKAPPVRKPKAPVVQEDWEFGIPWHKWPCPVAPLQRRMWCARWGKGDVPAWEHRKHIIRSIYTEEEYAWHAWDDRRMKAFSESNFVMSLGPASCLSGESRIYDPSTGLSPTILEIIESGEQPTVMTLYGAEKASLPFLKGEEELYEIVTDSGTFKCSASHRVLSRKGYLRADSLRVGDSLPGWHSDYIPLGSGASRPLSISEHDPSVRILDAPCFPKTASDSMVHCLMGSHRYDEPPLWGPDIDRSSSPSRADAHERIQRDLRAGDRPSSEECNRAYPPSFRPSNFRFSRQVETLVETCNPGLASGSFGHACGGFSPSWQSPSQTLPRPTSLESLHDEQDTRCLNDTSVLDWISEAYDISVRDAVILEIRRTEKEKFYDLTVPFAHHYFAEGHIHHNSGKTHNAAVMGVEWWLEAPNETAVIVCSTTKEMLKKRVWGSIVHYHSLLTQKGLGYVGELLDASCFIRWKQGDWKNGIAGVAVQDGPVEEAINNIVGMHTTRILWILDEMQGVREAIMGAIPNLLKNPESKMWGMGNPDSFTSMLCRYAEPIDGWKSIPKFTEEWEIHTHGYKGKGIGLFFDGRKSPAVLDPEWGRKHPWMINQEQIDAHLNSREVAGNENHPKFMTQSIGWPPSMGLESTVLDAAIIQTFKCTDRAVWTDGFTKCASLDPAFNGGDDAVLTFGKRGFVKDPEGERWVIECNEQIIVPIDAESSRPVHYQILDYCRAESERRGIRADEFAIAATGEGGGLVSIFEAEWGAVVGIEEGGSPSERLVDERGKTAKESYDTRASELCFAVRNFALGNGLRGLTVDIQKQLSARQTFYKGGKWCVEPKRGSKGRTDVSGRAAKGFKERMGYSPDHADSWQILIEHCRLKGAEPAFAVTAPKKAEEWNRRVQKQEDQWESHYNEEEDWKVYADA